MNGTTIKVNGDTYKKVDGNWYLVLPEKELIISDPASIASLNTILMIDQDSIQPFLSSINEQ